MEIFCDFKQVTWTSGLVYTAVVNEIKFDSSFSKIKTCHGVFGNGKDSASVRGIIFNEIPLDCVPKGIGKFFPSLNCFAITRCGLKTIQRSDLAGLRELTNIDFSNNELESLPDDLFNDVPRLARIRLSENKISRVSSKLLVHLEKTLIRVNFLNNALIHNYYYKTEYNTFESLMMEIDEKCLPPSDSHMGSLEKLFRSGKGSDLTVKVGDESFKAHKSFLIAQSPVLEKAIADDMEGPQSKSISLIGFSSEVVEDLLLFCYVGKLFCDRNLLEVNEAASIYEMPALLTYCEQHLYKHFASNKGERKNK